MYIIWFQDSLYTLFNVQYLTWKKVKWQHEKKWYDNIIKSGMITNYEFHHYNVVRCVSCWQKSGWTVCFLIPYSSQRLFTETPASYYFNSCSFSATERRVRFFFSIDIELDALALMPELDGLLWKYFEIGVGAMMLIRYGQHEIFTNGSVGVVTQLLPK